jgi:lysozyme family protein
MANFYEAYNLTNEHEGYYANVSWDLGKETYKGISRRFHASWSGWPLIDAWKKKNGAPRLNQNLDNDIPGLATAHYNYSKSIFWNAIKGDQIQNQKMANLLYDVYWGFPGIVKNLQNWLGVATDGKMGTQTVAALNNSNQAIIYEKINNWRLEQMQKSSIWPQAKEGWLARVMSYPQTIKDLYFANQKSGNGLAQAGIGVFIIFLIYKLNA